MIDSVLCGNVAFGDPLPGTVKQCQLWEDLPCRGDWEYRSAERGTCSPEGYLPTTIKYGHGDSWSAKQEISSPTGCNNGVFGDPIPGTVKECWFWHVPPTPAPTAPTPAPTVPTGAPTAEPTPEPTESPTPEPDPTEPGCYVRTMHGCPSQEWEAIDWVRDTHGEMKNNA